MTVYRKGDGKSQDSGDKMTDVMKKDDDDVSNEDHSLYLYSSLQFM